MARSVAGSKRPVTPREDPRRGRVVHSISRSAPVAQPSMHWSTSDVPHRDSASVFWLTSTITVGSRYPPTVLEESDLINGHGPAVKVGDTVTVRYVEVGYSTLGTVGQTTWGQMPETFVVGQGGLTAGEDEGVVGMRVGGRRELIIPPDLAYEGLSNVTVVFVVDLLRIS
jgi:peptidylprolyl isomerase